MVFQDRSDAGRHLAKALESFRGQDVVVLALPRGGVATALEVAKSLHAPLDLVITRKIGHPMSPEYAIGAVAEDGVQLLNEAEVEGLPQTWVRQEAERQIAEAKRRRQVYLKGRPPLDVSERVVILVDDGMATGFTALAAIQSLKKRHPARIVVAAPVAPPDTVERLRREADEVVVLHSPPAFFAIGEFYLDFRPVEDDQVVAMLAQAPAVEAGPPGSLGRGRGAGRWEHFSHGADIGVRGVGPSVESAFEQGALALTGVLIEPRSVEPSEAVEVRCESRDLEVLFVDWLNAIVYEMGTRNMLFGQFEVHIEGLRNEAESSGSKTPGFRLRATLRGEPVDVARHQPTVEVKGATFTCLSVRQEGGEWIAQCVVDV